MTAGLHTRQTGPVAVPSPLARAVERSDLDVLAALRAAQLSALRGASLGDVKRRAVRRGVADTEVWFALERLEIAGLVRTTTTGNAASSPCLYWLTDAGWRQVGGKPFGMEGAE